MLLDEVDAALDESNQALVAQLLKRFSQLSGAQVVCVSHNAAFQEACDATVNVSRGPSGASVMSSEKCRDRPRRPPPLLPTSAASHEVLAHETSRKAKGSKGSFVGRRI